MTTSFTTHKQFTNIVKAAMPKDIDPALRYMPEYSITYDLLGHLHRCESTGRAISLSRIESVIFGGQTCPQSMQFWRDAAEDTGLMHDSQEEYNETLKLLLCLFATMPIEDVMAIRNYYLDTYATQHVQYIPCI